MTMPNTNSMLSFSHIAYAAVVVLALGSRTCNCLQFTYPNFNTINRDDFSFSPGSTIADGALQITPSTGTHAPPTGADPDLKLPGVHVEQHMPTYQTIE